MTIHDNGSRRHFVTNIASTDNSAQNISRKRKAHKMDDPISEVDNFWNTLSDVDRQHLILTHGSRVFAWRNYFDERPTSGFLRELARKLKKHGATKYTVTLSPGRNNNEAP